MMLRNGAQGPASILPLTDTLLANHFKVLVTRLRNEQSIDTEDIDTKSYHQKGGTTQAVEFSNSDDESEQN